MSERFKYLLKASDDNNLTEQEQIELEEELSKLEIYQEHLDQKLNEEQAGASRDDTSWSLAPNKAKKLLMRGKRKARFWTAGTVFGLMVILLLLNSVFTSLYYATGKPSRQEIYADVLSSAFAITTPNAYVALNSGPVNVLGMSFFGPIYKQIGGSNERMGDFTRKFRLNMLYEKSMEEELWDRAGAKNLAFYLPKQTSAEVMQEEKNWRQDENDVQWSRLEQLAEGTVAEAFVSFDHYYSVHEAWSLFDGMELEPLLFAVANGEASGYVVRPLGFPVQPLWHEGDGSIVSKTKNDDGVTTTTIEYPSYTGADGEGVRIANFIDTLELLDRYKTITKAVIPTGTVKSTLNYVQEHGVRIYGMTVTGPVKELLKLKETTFTTDIRIGEVRLWNWEGRRS